MYRIGRCPQLMPPNSRDVQCALFARVACRLTARMPPISSPPPARPGPPCIRRASGRMSTPSLRGHLWKSSPAPHEVLRVATQTNTAILGMTNKLGAIVPGANADHIAVRGIPLGNLGLLQNQSACVDLIKASGTCSLAPMLLRAFCPTSLTAT